MLSDEHGRLDGLFQDPIKVIALKDANLHPYNDLSGPISLLCDDDCVDIAHGFCSAVFDVLDNT